MEHILIIDDDPILRQLIVETLKKTYDVATAADGESGVAAAISNPPDLIICDLNMPGIDGFTVFQRLQKVDTLIDVPFIFLSAFSHPDNVRHGMALGVDDFLAKPFSSEELHRIIRVRLDKRARRREIVLQAIEELRLNITASLPHELRTAITIIEGYTYLVLENADELDPVQREMVESIYVSASRLHRMAEKYEWYLRAHIFPGVRDENALTQPETVIHSVALETAQAFDRIGDLNMQLTAATIGIEEACLCKIVGEVIENAFKFSPANSPVSVTGIHNEDRYVISITNEGPGMSPEQIAQIGGFMQFDRKIYEQQGTGLGLIIAKRLTELYGGSLTITCSDHQTYLSVALPAINSEASLSSEAINAR